LTVVLVDHRMSLVEAMSDEIVCVAGGKLAAVGSPKELDRPGTLFYELKQLERTLGDDEGKGGKAAPAAVAAVAALEEEEPGELQSLG
jgi:ABC-type multidrug transport system ATPase subunit